ncbi:MAG: T9SS type A sorting domain-containing protein [Bacteroidia bacterium]|nr:T9SS type A sorting domain-containing protein [Bacteroidia bacterium]
MRSAAVLLAFILLGTISHAQTFDLLDSFSSDNTFLYTRTGIPSTFMGGDTSSQFTEFDGLITINGDAREAPDGKAIVHALTITRRGLETVRTSRRIVSQQSVTVIEADTLYEFLDGSEGCGSRPLRGWLFPDTTWNSPPCPNLPDTLRLYPYGRYYRSYTPGPSDSLDIVNGVLRLRSLRTDCLDYAQQLEFRIETHGLAEILRSEFNFFDWSSEERWRRTVTPRVEDAPQHPSSITLTVHPNPAREHLTIRIAADQGGPFTVLLHDIHGRALATFHDSMHEIMAPDVTFNLRSFNSGMYFCTVRTAAGAKTVPFVVISGR